MIPTEPVLEFTGERFTPECVREIWYEHMHRYALAARLASGRRVLDAACGEGYGSAMLHAAGAAEVVGVDLSAATVEHARRRYQARAGLRFEQGDVTALGTACPGPFDLIVSFETLEHVERQGAMLDGFRERLARDGVLLVSTPDRKVYSEASGQANPFHVRELYREEFEQMLRARFPAVRLFGQKLLFQSVLWEPGRDGPWAASTHGGGDGLGYAPVYWIAACALTQEPLAALPTLHLFGDAEESVYRHYDHEVRQNIRAGHRILELEAQLAELQRRLDGAQPPPDPKEQG